MELGLEHKVVLVTGGSKGIGRAIALAFLHEGASVLICARGQQGLDERWQLLIIRHVNVSTLLLRT